MQQSIIVLIPTFESPDWVDELIPSAKFVEFFSGIRILSVVVRITTIRKAVGEFVFFLDFVFGETTGIVRWGAGAGEIVTITGGRTLVVDVEGIAVDTSGTVCGGCEAVVDGEV